MPIIRRKDLYVCNKIIYSTCLLFFQLYYNYDAFDPRIPTKPYKCESKLAGQKLVCNIHKTWPLQMHAASTSRFLSLMAQEPERVLKLILNFHC